MDAPSGVLTPVAVSFISHPYQKQGGSVGSVMLPNMPSTAEESAGSAASVGGESDAQTVAAAASLAVAGAGAVQDTAEKDEQMPILYSVAPQFKETAFLPSSSESRVSGATGNTVPTPATSSKLQGGAQAQQMPPSGAVLASTQPGGNTLDAPVSDGTGRRGPGFLGSVSELQAGLSPAQQAMKMRARANLKSDLEKQVRSDPQRLTCDFCILQHECDNARNIK